MADETRENLNDLLRQFLDADEAEAASKEISAGEQLLEAFPAPSPNPEILARVKGEIAVALGGRHKIRRTLRRSLAAAAVIAFALVGLLDRRPMGSNNIFQAAILPPAIWDSMDVAAGDLDLARFTAEARQIEAQFRELEAGEDEAVGGGAVEELERELMQIETEYRKG